MVTVGRALCGWGNTWHPLMTEPATTKANDVKQEMELVELSPIEAKKVGAPGVGKRRTSESFSVSLRFSW